MHQCPEILYWKKSWNCCNLNATALDFAGGGGFCKNDSRLYRASSMMPTQTEEKRSSPACASPGS